MGIHGIKKLQECVLLLQCVLLLDSADKKHESAEDKEDMLGEEK